MTANKLVNILGGGLLSAAILLLILWTMHGPPQAHGSGPVPLIGISIGFYFLFALLFLFSGFLLSMATPEEKFGIFYLRYGCFLGVLLLVLSAGSAAYGSRYVIWGDISSPGFTILFGEFIIGDGVLLIITTIFCSIGFWLGDKIKTSKILATPQPDNL